MADELTGKQRRHLRALGHHLDPVVQVGQDGVSDAVVGQADAQLDAHELIKVKIGESSPQDRHEAADMLAARTQAQVAQVLGRTVLLYRPRKGKPQIVLPR
ncbi:MAG TPA: ribosome assembly RNA-binding protein YhbY [Myxococcales bacterium]